MAEKAAKYFQMKAPTFLVTANGIAAAYSLLQASLCIFSKVKGNVLFSKPIAWFNFSTDQLMAYLTLSAAATAAQSDASEVPATGVAVDEGMRHLRNQIGEEIVCGPLVSFVMATISAISAFSLFRLYGGKKNSKW